MEVSMAELVVTTSRALILGAFLGAMYDVVRILRVLFGVSKYNETEMLSSLYSRGVKNLFSNTGGKVFSVVFLAVTDFIFFAAATVVFVLFLYCYNYGRFRWFILLSSISGFWIYYHTLGRLIVIVSGRISEIFRFVINVAVYVILLPVRFTARLLKRVYYHTILKCISWFKTSIDKSRNKRYTLKCIEKINDFVKFRV